MTVPAYDLAQVQAAARCLDFQFGREAEKQRLNLEYSDDEIREIFEALTLANFDKTHQYEWGIADAYTIAWRHYVPSQKRYVTDNLYIKFKVYLDGGKPMLIVSFHT